MKALFPALTALLFAFPAFACQESFFAAKICVSSQAQELGGAEMASLACESRKAHEAVYASLLEAFRHSPEWFRKRLCSLNRVAVYPLRSGTALSWSYPKLNAIGVNRARIDENYDLAIHGKTMLQHAKRKKMELGRSPEGFGYHVEGKDEGAGLRYLLAHELGHLLYNPQDTNLRQKHFHGCQHIFGSYVCPNFKEGQFGFIDWIVGSGETANIVRGEVQSSHRAIHDFAVATDPVPFTPEELDEFFRGLHQSSFVSAFALFSPEEDFCETLAHMVMAESAPGFFFEEISGKKLDVWGRVKRPAISGLKAKVEFLRAYLGLN